uniref:NADH-ubiquinone oxidoreductase chain 4L n=1 Tax=Diolcogaster sp. SNS-2016 TaxID=1911508 RepID=A0A6F8AA67_9HYME|nr:NADH dehydrogenase subunit 4L [Diolcogaster sp. SNS-2016]
MINWLMNLLFFLFLFSMLMYSSFYKHLLMSLISLEFIILSLSLMIYKILLYMNLNLYFISYLWIIFVCESILGLSILVFLVRKTGNDYTSLMNLN